MATQTWTTDQVDDQQGGAYDPGLYRHQGIARTVPGPPHQLPPAAFDDYARQGYLAVDDVLNAGQVRPQAPHLTV